MTVNRHIHQSSGNIVFFNFGEIHTALISLQCQFICLYHLICNSKFGPGYPMLCIRGEYLHTHKKMQLQFQNMLLHLMDNKNQHLIAVDTKIELSLLPLQITCMTLSHLHFSLDIQATWRKSAVHLFEDFFLTHSGSLTSRSSVITQNGVLIVILTQIILHDYCIMQGVQKWHNTTLNHPQITKQLSM